GRAETFAVSTVVASLQAAWDAPQRARSTSHLNFRASLPVKQDDINAIPELPALRFSAAGKPALRRPPWPSSSWWPAGSGRCSPEVHLGLGITVLQVQTVAHVTIQVGVTRVDGQCFAVTLGRFLPLAFVIVEDGHSPGGLPMVRVGLDRLGIGRHRLPQVAVLL